MTAVGDDNIKSYIWVYNSSADSPAGNVKRDNIPNIALFDYQPSRSGQCAANFLKGYCGYLCVGGYAGYNRTLAILVACLAHIRRKFMEAKKAQGKNAKADWSLNHIQKIYQIKTQIKHLSVDERYRIRQERALPLLTQFKTWLDKSSLALLLMSLLGKAINYAIVQWEKFLRYCEDGRINIDNNRSERIIKSFVINRKAWLASKAAKGPYTSAVLYSIIETAKASGIKP